MHIKEYLIERNFPFSEEGDKIIIDIPNDLELTNVNIDGLSNCIIKCHRLFLSSFNATNLNGLVFSGNGIGISSSDASKTRYIRLFANQKLRMPNSKR